MGNLLTRITDCQRQMKNMFDVFEGTTPKVLILGLDGAGKTTFLYSAKLDDFIYAIAPPKGVIIEHVTPRRGATLQLFDFPGSKLVRHLWHNWFQNTQGIIFVVDSTDRIRVDEAKFELHDLLTSGWLRKVPLVVVANKQDLPECMTENEVANELDLHSIKNRDWSIFSVSSKNKKGVKHVFEDMVEKVKAFRHYRSSLNEEKTKRQAKEKDNDIEIKDNKKSVFTNIEDVDAMEEKKIPSLFENISKAYDIEKDSKDEETDSGSASKESVTYDQLNGNKESIEYSGGEKPDSISDSGSLKSDKIEAKDNPEIEASIEKPESISNDESSGEEKGRYTSGGSISENNSVADSETEDVVISNINIVELSNEGATNDSIQNNEVPSMNDRKCPDIIKYTAEGSEDNNTENDYTSSVSKTKVHQAEMVTDLDNVSDDEVQNLQE